jgi:hypothetical protein
MNITAPFVTPKKILEAIKMRAEKGAYHYSTSTYIDDPGIRGLRSLGFKVEEVHIKSKSMYQDDYYGTNISWKEANG